jgi:metal-responsive CopG/Arc/MetJ family transcriptional regulator
MPTLSMHLPAPLYKKVRAAARRSKQKPSQFARQAIEHELRRVPPAVTMRALAGTASLVPDYDPVAPVIPSEDWGQ